MSVDELRAGFERLTEGVVPVENPHGRLMTRRRGRIRARVATFAATVAAVAAGALLAPSTLLNAADGPPPPDPLAELSVESPYLSRLIKAPVRGNLSGDTKMVAEAEQTFTQIGSVDARLVFLHETKQMLTAVAVYQEGGSTIAVTGVAPAGEGPRQLNNTGTYPVTPFLVIPIDLDAETRSVVGLAPPRCEVESSGTATVTKGVWNRSFVPEPTHDYVFRTGVTKVNELWRVRCEGRVREVRPADDYPSSQSNDLIAMHQQMLRYVGATPSGKPSVLWSAVVPGLGQGTLVGPQTEQGPVTLQFGMGPKAHLALEPPSKTSPSPPSSPSSSSSAGTRSEWAMVSYGMRGPNGLTAVRLPQRLGDLAVLGDRVLVLAGTNFSRIEALDGMRVVSSAPVNGGVGLLTVPVGMATEIRGVGGPTTSFPFNEPTQGRRVMTDNLISDWI